MNIFSGKNIILIVLTIIVIAIRINYVFLYNEYYEDKSHQVNCSVNILKGNGFCESETDLTDLSKIKYHPLDGRPTGYSILVAAVQYFCNDLLLSINILDSLFICLFIYSIIGIFKTLNFSRKSLYLILWFYAITFSLFYNASSSDLIAFSIYQLVIYIAIKNLHNTNWKHTVFIALLSFSPSLIRYAYQLLSFVIPLSFFISGYYFNNKRVLNKGICTGIITFCCLLLFNLYEKFRMGDYLMIKDKIGIHFENLLQFTYFPFDSFFFMKSLVIKYNDTINGLTVAYKIFTLLTSILIIVFSIYQFVRLLKRRKQGVPLKENLFNFYSMGMLTIFFIIITLSYLSVRYAPQEWKNPPWTYVSESRYFSAGIIFLQIVIFSSVYEKNKKWLSFIIRSFVTAVFIFCFAYWINEKYNIYFHKTAHTFSFEYKEQLETCSIINNLKLKTDKKIIYVENEPRSVNFVTDVTGIYSGSSKYTKLINSNLNSGEPVLIIIVIPKKLSLIEKNFIQKFKAEKIYSMESKDIYKISI